MFDKHLLSIEMGSLPVAFRTASAWRYSLAIVTLSSRFSLPIRTYESPSIDWNVFYGFNPIDMLWRTLSSIIEVASSMLTLTTLTSFKS